MDKIFMNELDFYGYHGVLPEEKKLGQRFIVDLTLELNLREAGLTDDLTKTVNYAEVYQTVKTVVEGPPFKLIEALAEKISDHILNEYSLVQNCKVKLIKPNPPIAGHYTSVAVEIRRGRYE